LFYELAMASIDVDHWLRARGVNMEIALAVAGPIYECPIIPFGTAFQFGEKDERGAVSAVVHVVTGADAETPIGLVAWRRDRPEQVLTYPAGGLPALGIDQIDNPASYFGGKPLKVHRSPLGWLSAGCCGIVPLDLQALWWALIDLPERRDGYPLAAEDLQHADELVASLNPLPTRIRLLVPAGTKNKEVRSYEEADRDRTASTRNSSAQVGDGRNAAIATLAGQLLRRYVNPFLTLEMLTAWNAMHCKPPLSNVEVQDIVNSIAGREIKRRGAAHG
jgi:hypothetical protein